MGGIVDIIGLVINYSFDKSSEKQSDLGDGVIDDGSTNMQVVLHNEVEGQQVLVFYSINLYLVIKLYLCFRLLSENLNSSSQS